VNINKLTFGAGWNSLPAV